MAITNFLPKTRALVDRIYDFCKARPALYNMILKIAQRHDNWMGYRKYGLIRDDILPSENPVVQEAISRLSEKEAFDRTFRIRRAIQLYINHEELPEAEQIPQSLDKPYLWNKIEAICRERDEKEMFDALLPRDTEALTRNLRKSLNNFPK